MSNFGAEGPGTCEPGYTHVSAVPLLQKYVCSVMNIRRNIRGHNGKECGFECIIRQVPFYWIANRRRRREVLDV